MDDTIIDIGDTVVCDFCNLDYTDSDESGGVLIGSFAVCPRCAPDAIRNAEKYHEPVDAVCPPHKSFKQWVLDMRGGDNTIRISFS
ncbi:MAG: hypothetical protein AAB539_03760 [Patescibacteria group bacterium]